MYFNVHALNVLSNFFNDYFNKMFLPLYENMILCGIVDFIVNVHV